jgi:nitrite reductase/ring-hydroxylating ferredoxin subunit
MDDFTRRGQEPPVACSFHQWREDFPINWENDHYVTRRELTKFLTLGSGLLAGTNCLMAVLGAASGERRQEPAVVAGAAELPVGGSLLFRYPTEKDPCILVRDEDGTLQAYSQVCTHLACAVVHRPEERTLYCPCHHGYFAVTDGEPTAGPPTRRLPRILLEEREGQVWAVGVEV